MKAESRDRRRAGSFVICFLFLLNVVGLRTVSGQQPSTSPVPQSSLSIQHDPLGCVTAELAPKVDASVAPPPQFDRGYVYFRAAGTEDFYYTPMKGTPQSLEGVLPRPLPETKAIDYKVRARDVGSLNAETKEYNPPVVPGTACKGKGVGVGKGGAGLTVGLTREGQYPVPPGFNKKDIAFVILATGATVAIASALAAGGSSAAAAPAVGASAGGSSGGGVSTGVLVAGGVVVAGGAALAIAKSGGGTSNTATPLPTLTSTPSPTSTPTRTPTPTATASQARIDAVAEWAVVGTVDVQILDPSGQPVGMVFPVGCQATLKQARVVVQNAPTGTYRLTLTGRSCGSGTPPAIRVTLTVSSDSGLKCPPSFVDVPVGQTIQGCQFTVP